METIKNYKETYKYWWLILIVGIISILFGIWVLWNPIESYVSLTLYFCIMFILFGISEIINAYSGKKQRNWGWGLALGIMDLLIGIVLLIDLAWAAIMLPYISAFILMFMGIDFIGRSTQMQSLGIRNWGWILTGGILTLLFSFLIIFHPLFGALNIVIWTGLAFILGGISATAFSFTIKGDKPANKG